MSNETKAVSELLEAAEKVSRAEFQFERWGATNMMEEAVRDLRQAIKRLKEDTSE